MRRPSRFSCGPWRSRRKCSALIIPTWLAVWRIWLNSIEKPAAKGSPINREIGREKSARRDDDGGERLLGEMAESGELHALRAFGPDRLGTTARFFQDLDLVEGGRRLSWMTLMAGTSPGHDGKGIVSSMRVGRRPVRNSH